MTTSKILDSRSNPRIQQIATIVKCLETAEQSWPEGVALAILSDAERLVLFDLSTGQEFAQFPGITISYADGYDDKGMVERDEFEQEEGDLPKEAYWRK